MVSPCLNLRLIIDQHILTKQPSNRFQNVIQQVVFFYCESDSLSNISSISKPIFVPILSFNSVKEVSYNFVLESGGNRTHLQMAISSRL